MTSPDAIIIPGGGVRGSELTPWAKRRFDRALELWSGEWILALSAATVHKLPPIDARGFPVLECVAGARYMVERGVPADRILLDWTSYDTIGNAYFARLLHCDPRGWRRLLVVNSAFHMPRTEAIFRFVFGLDGAPYELAFEAVSDAGLDDLLAARKAKEMEGAQAWRKTIQRIGSMRDLYEWLHTQHAAYATKLLLNARAPLPVDEADSY